uniref:ATP binding cassette subfamily A member 12 n=1 Tax=Nomascus leucogenys TaxID=61853 RepID=A0A2I3GI13_NOMLE
MASLFHQLQILVWKNWLGVKRQPLWTLVLILWPVIIFIILAITRTKFPPTAKPTWDSSTWDSCDGWMAQIFFSCISEEIDSRYRVMVAQ